GQGGEPGDPVLLPEGGDGAHGSHCDGERCFWEDGRSLREDRGHDCSVCWSDLGSPWWLHTAAARLLGGPEASGGGVSLPGWWAAARDCGEFGCRPGSVPRWCRRGAGSGSSRAGARTHRDDTNTKAANL